MNLQGQSAEKAIPPPKKTHYPRTQSDDDTSGGEALSVIYTLSSSDIWCITLAPFFYEPKHSMFSCLGYDGTSHVFEHS